MTYCATHGWWAGVPCPYNDGRPMSGSSLDSEYFKSGFNPAHLEAFLAGTHIPQGPSVQCEVTT